MAHHKAAKKSIRQADKRRTQNRYHAKTTRNAVKRIRISENKAEAEKELPKVIALLDKLAKRNVIHKNKASNLKSGLMKKVKAMA